MMRKDDRQSQAASLESKAHCHRRWLHLWRSVTVVPPWLRVSCLKLSVGLPGVCDISCHPVQPQYMCRDHIPSRVQSCHPLWQGETLMFSTQSAFFSFLSCIFKQNCVTRLLKLNGTLLNRKMPLSMSGIMWKLEGFLLIVEIFCISSGAVPGVNIKLTVKNCKRCSYNQLGFQLKYAPRVKTEVQNKY